MKIVFICKNKCIWNWNRSIGMPFSPTENCTTNKNKNKLNKKKLNEEKKWAKKSYSKTIRLKLVIIYSFDVHCNMVNCCATGLVTHYSSTENGKSILNLKKKITKKKMHLKIYYKIAFHSSNQMIYGRMIMDYCFQMSSGHTLCL